MLKNSSPYAIILLIVLGISVGCQTNSTDPAPDDLTYFPLQLGDYWVYQVTQQTYSSINSATKRVYQVQEKITGSYSQNGQSFFLMEESTRQTDQSEWQISAIRTVYKNVTEAVSVDNNVPVIRLVFPFSSATSWNTNAYNANPDTLLSYEDLGRSFTIGKQTFTNTISVVGTEDSTLINLDKNRRVYAPNVGLIYRQNASLDYCQSSADCIGKAIIEAGTSQTWELISSSRLP